MGSRFWELNNTKKMNVSNFYINELKKLNKDLSNFKQDIETLSEKYQAVQNRLSQCSAQNTNSISASKVVEFLITDFGVQLIKTRQIFGYSQENMANFLGIGQTTYGNIERSVNKVSLERMTEIVNIFDITFDEFIEHNVEYLTAKANENNKVFKPI